MTLTVPVVNPVRLFALGWCISTETEWIGLGGNQSSGFGSSGGNQSSGFGSSGQDSYGQSGAFTSPFTPQRTNTNRVRIGNQSSGFGSSGNTQSSGFGSSGQDDSYGSGGQSGLGSNSGQNFGSSGLNQSSGGNYGSSGTDNYGSSTGSGVAPRKSYLIFNSKVRLKVWEKL